MTEFYNEKLGDSPRGVANLLDETPKKIETDEEIKKFLEKAFTELYTDVNKLSEDKLSMKQQDYTETFIEILTKSKLDSDKKKDKSLKRQLLNIYIALVNQYALDTFLSVVSLDDSSDRLLKKGGGKMYVLRQGQLIEINESDMQSGDQPLTVSRSSAQEMTCFTLPQSQPPKRENIIYKTFMDCFYPVTDAVEQLRALQREKLLEQEKQEIIKAKAATSMALQRAAIINNQVTPAEMRDDCTSGAACCFSVIAASTVPGIYAQGCGGGVYNWLSSFVYETKNPDCLTLLGQVGQGFTDINPKFIVVGLLCGVGAYCCAQRSRRMAMNNVRLAMITNEELAGKLDHRSNGDIGGALMGIANVANESGVIGLLPGGSMIERGIKSIEKSRKKKSKHSSKDNKLSTKKNLLMNGAACDAGSVADSSSPESSSSSSSSSARSSSKKSTLRRRRKEKKGGKSRKSR